jgi:hypothetical protein
MFSELNFVFKIEYTLKLEFGDFNYKIEFTIKFIVQLIVI